jgi:rRNA processing protein Gar1
MQFLGEIETITNDGKIVIRAVTAPEVNNTVFDNRDRKIGTVKRILGPVDSPYASVAGDNIGPKLKGKNLFFNQSEKDGGFKRKGRKN